MKSYGELSPSDRRLYHNPVNGAYRLEALRTLLDAVL
jgi:hypothetical protein